MLFFQVWLGNFIQFRIQAIWPAIVASPVHARGGCACKCGMCMVPSLGVAEAQAAPDPQGLMMKRLFLYNSVQSWQGISRAYGTHTWTCQTAG